MTGGDKALVTVLMATRNGAAFLADQLQSLQVQSHENWRLKVSDDGSTDATLSMLETFQVQNTPGRVSVLRGPERGATANFLSLIERTGPDDGCLAFCDQDDVWLSEKLERAVAALKGCDGPALYACRAVITDEWALGDQLSLPATRALGFEHALAENTLPGNAMVLNAAGCDMVRRAISGVSNRHALEVGFHDWFVYQLIAAAGGTVFLDPVPGLRYRQHIGNAVGSGLAKGPVSRIKRALGGDYGRALRGQALALLQWPDLPEDRRRQVEDLLDLPALWILQRPAVIRRIGLYRQSRAEDLILKLLLICGRV